MGTQDISPDEMEFACLHVFVGHCVHAVECRRVDDRANYADARPSRWIGADINLLKCLVGYLADRNFVDKAIEMQKIKGDEALMKALKGPLHMDKFAPYLTEKHSATEQDIIFITGVGSVWPLLRAHNLLNSLHSLLGHKPVVLFYPGQYNGQAMSLFGRIPSNNYYRAFRLVP